MLMRAAVLLPLLLVPQSADAREELVKAAQTCQGQPTDCEASAKSASTKSTSLLQLSSSQVGFRRNSQGLESLAFAPLGGEPLVEGESWLHAMPGSEQQSGAWLPSLATPDLQLSQLSAAGGNSATPDLQLSQLSAAGGNLATPDLQLSQVSAAGANRADSRNEASKLMTGAAEEAQSAERSAANDATRAQQTAEALEELHQKSQEAQVAQDLTAKKGAEVGRALVGAMQRVQQASEVEMQELAMETEVGQRLQEAAKNARQVQMLEDTGADAEAKAADLLQDAIAKLKLQNANMEDAANSPVSLLLSEVEKAQSVVAAEAKNKARASELLQQSLQGAANAVEGLKASKEAQTARWLQDAFRELQWMYSSWNQRLEAEAKVAKGLDGAVRSSEEAAKLAGGTSGAKQSAVALLQNVVQKISSAHNMASQEATAAQASEAREALKSRSLQQALRKLQAFEQAHQSSTALQMQAVQTQAVQNAKVSQLSTYLTGLIQNVKAQSDAQQVQLSEVMQQVSRAMGTQPMPAPQVPGAGMEQFMPQLSPEAPMQMQPETPPLNNYWGY